MKRLFYFFDFSIFFVLQWIMSHLNISRRLLFSKESSLQPTLILLETTIQSKAGRFFLSHAITLTPGTITVGELQGQYMIYVFHSDSDDETHKSLVEFSKRIERTFG